MKPDIIKDYLVKMGLDISKGYILLYIKCWNQSVVFSRLMDWLTPSHEKIHLWCDPFNADGLIVICSIERKASIKWLKYVLAQSMDLGLSVGMGCYDVDYLHISMQYQWARAACQPVDSSAFPSHIYEESFLSFVGSKLSEEKILGLPSIIILENYDLKYGSHHLDVLKTYFKCNMNKSLTAKVLNVHRNTVQKHLDRIRELTDIDVEERRLRLPIELYLFMQEQGCISVESPKLPPIGVL